MVATTWGFLPWYLSYIYIRMYHSIIYLRSNFWGFKVRSNLSEMDTLPMPAFPALERQVDEFRTYVRPTCHPVLTDFCKELTGIQQEQARHRHGRLLMMPLRYSMLFLKKAVSDCQNCRENFRDMLDKVWHPMTRLPWHWGSCQLQWYHIEVADAPLWPDARAMAEVADGSIPMVHMGWRSRTISYSGADQGYFPGIYSETSQGRRGEWCLVAWVMQKPMQAWLEDRMQTLGYKRCSKGGVWPVMAGWAGRICDKPRSNSDQLWFKASEHVRTWCWRVCRTLWASFFRHIWAAPISGAGAVGSSQKHLWEDSLKVCSQFSRCTENVSIV